MTAADSSFALIAGEPLTLAAARARRLTWRDLNDRDVFLKVAHGLYTPRPESAEREFAARAAAVVRAAGERAAACDVTGLRLLGVDLPRRLEDGPIHVLLPAGVTAWPRAAGVVAHRQKWGVPPRQAGGITVAEPEICLAQVAGRATRDELVILGDGLMRRQNPLTSPPGLASFLRYAKGRRGVARIRSVLPLLRAGTDSPRETVSRLLLVDAGLPCPTVNLRVVTPDGPRFLDMAYEEANLGFEYDGRIHQREGGAEADARRRRLLQDLGWEIINITDHDLVRDPDSVVRSVALALGRRAPQCLEGLRLSHLYPHSAAH
ncbi:MAG: endonuclease domain-containing protein [Propionibacteriaceae bacterium]|jgi:hypothetical protein|nr:endonuclease domain-containing protein [Propionibacteriaceae bacterium]